MRALFVAILLAFATAIPAFADDDAGSNYRPPVTVDVSGIADWTP